MHPYVNESRMKYLYKYYYKLNIKLFIEQENYSWYKKTRSFKFVPKIKTCEGIGPGEYAKPLKQQRVHTLGSPRMAWFHLGNELTPVNTILHANGNRYAK